MTTKFANARDIGGLPLVGGGTTASGILFRSDAPQPGDEPPDLEPWPPTVVVDLRSADERTVDHPLGAISQVIDLPLLTDVDPVKLVTEGSELTLDVLYAAILTGSAHLIVEMARQVATTDGSCLVHCSAGKDRTGVSVAVILAAVGVEREAIVADYAATEVNMGGVFDRLVRDLPDEQRVEIRQRLADMPADLGLAPPSAVESVLDRLDAEGGAGKYLTSNGLSETELMHLRERLTSGRHVTSPANYLATWNDLERSWQAVTDRAMHLRRDELHRRVNGEWSFLETLRHLVFATDCWVRRTILNASDYWPAGVPHDEAADEDGIDTAIWGIESDASPSVEEILAARRERLLDVRAVIAGLTAQQLGEHCRPNSAPGHPDDPRRFTVGECLDVVIREERGHLGYAERDLALLSDALPGDALRGDL